MSWSTSAPLKDNVVFLDTRPDAGHRRLTIVLVTAILFCLDQTVMVVQASPQTLTMEAPLSPETETNMKTEKYKKHLTVKEHLPWATPEEFNYLLKRVEELEEKLNHAINFSNLSRQT